MQIHLPLDGLRSTYRRVPNRFFGIRDFPNLKLGIRDFKTKSGKNRGLKLCVRVRMREKTLGITGLHSILGRVTGLKNRIEDPHTVG